MESKAEVKSKSQALQTTGPATIAKETGIDVEMKDADVENTSAGHSSLPSTKVMQPGTQPLPPPPWPSQAPNGQSDSGPHHPRVLHRSANLHVDLPPPPRLNSSFNSMDTSMSATPGILSSHSTQSSYLPAPLPTASSGPPLLTPLSGTAFAQPSPVKKKMSLSAYTAAKLKAKTPGSEQTSTMDESGGSPQESRREPPATAGSDQQQPGSSPAAAKPPPTQKDDTQKDDVEMG